MPTVCTFISFSRDYYHPSNFSLGLFVLSLFNFRFARRVYILMFFSSQIQVLNTYLIGGLFLLFVFLFFSLCLSHYFLPLKCWRSTHQDHVGNGSKELVLNSICERMLSGSWVPCLLCRMGVSAPTSLFSATESHLPNAQPPSPPTQASRHRWATVKVLQP